MKDLNIQGIQKFILIKLQKTLLHIIISVLSNKLKILLDSILSDDNLML